MKRKLLILTPMRPEAKAVATALGYPRHDGIESLTIEVHGVAVTLHTIGIRAVRMPDVSAFAEAAAVVLAGLAGALDPSLRVGDIVVDAPPGLVPDELPWKRGRICAAGRIVSTAQEKAELCAATGALAVDMERDVVARAVDGHGATCIAIRAVSDSADEAVDPAVLGFVDDLGRPRPGAITCGLFRKPGLIHELNRLAQDSKLALQRLGEAMHELFASEHFIMRATGV